MNKKRYFTLTIVNMLIFISFGLISCGEGNNVDYFKVVPIDNYKIEYDVALNDNIDKYCEVRQGNRLAFKTTSTDCTSHHSYCKDTEWTIYKNKTRGCFIMGDFSWIARQTHLYKQQIKNQTFQKDDMIFLNRNAVSFKFEGILSVGENPKQRFRYVEEFVVDKEYDIVLAKYFTNLDKTPGLKQLIFEVTLFEVGGQSLPN